MADILFKRAHPARDRHTRRMPCEDEGRGQGGASTSHGKPRIARKVLEMTRSSGKMLSHSPQKESNSPRP